MNAMRGEPMRGEAMRGEAIRKEVVESDLNGFVYNRANKKTPKPMT